MPPREPGDARAEVPRAGVEAPVGLLERATSPHTRRAYAMARRQLDAWLEGRPLDDSNLAAYPGAPSRGRPRARDRCNGGRHRQA